MCVTDGFGERQGECGKARESNVVGWKSTTRGGRERRDTEERVNAEKGGLIGPNSLAAAHVPRVRTLVI